MADTTDTESDTGPGAEQLVLNAASFTASERLECQTRFDASFGDLLSAMYEAVDTRREGAATILIVDRDGVHHFPDQIIQFMLWVQAKRDDPDADLADFDDLRFSDLTRAHIRGLLGKGSSSTSSNRSTPESGSADSSKD